MGGLARLPLGPLLQLVEEVATAAAVVTSSEVEEIRQGAAKWGAAADLLLAPGGVLPKVTKVRRGGITGWKVRKSHTAHPHRHGARWSWIPNEAYPWLSQRHM